MNQNYAAIALAICFFAPSCADESSNEKELQEVSQSGKVETVLSDTKSSPSSEVESETVPPTTLVESEATLSDGSAEESRMSIDGEIEAEFLSAYSISTQWFGNQDPTVQRNIVEKRFYWGPVPGGLKLGVVNEKGKFITWDGAKPFDPDEPYLVIGDSIGKGGPQTSVKF